MIDETQDDVNGLLFLIIFDTGFIFALYSITLRGLQLVFMKENYTLLRIKKINT